MLASKYRLRGTYYISRVKEKGKYYQYDTFGMAVYKRGGINGDKNTKFVFVVSTKIAKQAVDRNRIKRMLSEAVRFECTNLKVGYDVAFLTKPSVLRTPTDVVMKDVNKALKKAKLID